MIDKNGREVDFPIHKYRINWDKAAPSKIARQFKAFLYLYCKNNIILEEFKLPNLRLRCDFVDLNLKVAYEINGVQHEKFVPFYHKNRTGYLKSLKRDEDKMINLELNGFKLVEVFDKDMPVTKEWLYKEHGIKIA